MLYNGFSPVYLCWDTPRPSMEKRLVPVKKLELGEGSSPPAFILVKRVLGKMVSSDLCSSFRKFWYGNKLFCNFLTDLGSIEWCHHQLQLSFRFKSWGKSTRIPKSRLICGVLRLLSPVGGYVWFHALMRIMFRFPTLQVLTFSTQDGI